MRDKNVRHIADPDIFVGLGSKGLREGDGNGVLETGGAEDGNASDLELTCSR